MKKLIKSALALATILFAASCQQENLEPAQSGSTVTYSVSVPEVATKAIGSGENVDQLVYAVYQVTGKTEEQAKTTLSESELLYQKTAVVDNGVAVAHLELINDQTYLVLFWAQVENQWFAADSYHFGTKGISYPNDYAPNNDNFAAFSNVSYITVTGSEKKSITLTRPFAQLNIATNLPDPQYFTPVIAGTTVKVEGAATAYNVATGKATEAELTFVETAPIDENFKGYDSYLSMNYVFVPDQQATVKVSYTVRTEAHGTVTNTIENVPVAKNYKTNIVGNLLTSKVDYNVELEKDWNDDGKDMVVVTEGVVKNIKGDYEVTTETGLAYAINNLFKDGGNFYLTKALYEMAGYDVNPPTVPEGKVLNVYGEVPVVTRSSAATFGSVTITGLTQPFIGTVSGAVSVSGISIPEEENEVSILVNEVAEGAALVVDEVEAMTIVNTGEVTDANEINSFASLKAALATGVKVINITADITAPEVLYIKNSVVVNGNSKKFTTSANRAFRLIESGIEVTINNLNIVSTAVRVNTNDVRGVSIDGTSEKTGAMLENITLTLNNCSHDFTDPSANDWAYAVNVVGGKGYKVTVDGGVYEGANVINIRGESQTVVVKNTTLNCTYPANEVYYGACIWVQQNQGSSVYAEGNTFNGSNAIAFNLGTGTALEEKDNTDNTNYYKFKAGQGFFYTLAEAVESIESTGEIKVLYNAEADAVTIPNGKAITLNLNEKTLKGVDKATGSYGLITNNGTLTVVGPGTMNIVATENRGWNAYSSVISNSVGGNLIVKGGAVIEHLGGTDMAYGIDNLTNGKGTSAITTVETATVKSPYRAIRQFLNGIDATNELYVKAGAHIEGANKSIWMQDPSANANTGELVVDEGAELYGDVYLFVTAGSTSWPVSASIPTSTLKDGSEVISGNVPEGYTVEEVSGVWQIIKWTKVSTADELVAALEANQNVIFANDIKIDPANMSNAYGATGINVKNGQAIDGKGYTLNIKGAGGTWDSGINTTGGVIKNLTVTGSFRGIFINHTSDYSEKVVLENVTIGGNGTVYTISCDQGLYQTIEATNCTFNGWTSFAKTAGEAKFVNCYFGEGSDYKYCRPYSNTEFVGCTFCPGYYVDTTKATVTFTDCTWEE